MREAMPEHRGETGEAEDDLVDAACRGVAVKAGARVAVGKRAHLRQGVGEIARRSRRHVLGALALRPIRTSAISSSHLRAPSARSAERRVRATNFLTSSA